MRRKTSRREEDPPVRYEQLKFLVKILLELEPRDRPDDAPEAIKELVAIANEPERPRLRLIVDNTTPPA